jgi:hypothetical protein
MTGEEYTKSLDKRLPWLTRNLVWIWIAIATVGILISFTSGKYVDPVVVIGPLIMSKLAQMDHDYKRLALIWADREQAKEALNAQT